MGSRSAMLRSAPNGRESIDACGGVFRLRLAVAAVTLYAGAIRSAIDYCFD